uniref:Putative trypsin-like serine protease n=1 Tax=Rhipicephalus microplus TaxID=6941 RepID=A0A6G5A6U7_RHIMP
MMYFVVGVSLLLGSSASVRADGLQINGPECGMSTHGMIVNGTAAEASQFPWMVYLQMIGTNNGRSACGGSILTKRHILTAAHCTLDPYGQPFKRINAYYGNNDWKRGKSLLVIKIFRHHKYIPTKHANDIAVLQVEKPFQYGNNARPICIPAAPMNIFDTETVVAGWGRLKEGGHTTNHLQYTTVRVLPNELCSVLYFILGYVSDVMYCAYRRGTNSCHGDSGGPLMSRPFGDRYVQVGIVSFAVGCARKYIPTVYTRVETFTPWLRRVVGSFDKAYSSQVSLQLASYTIPQWPSIFPSLRSYAPFFA